MPRVGFVEMDVGIDKRRKHQRARSIEFAPARRRCRPVARTNGSASTPGGREFDAAGALVFPALVDAHVHLDKTHTWHRAPNRSGTFWEALATLANDKDNWTEADIRLRAGFALRTAW